MNINKKLSGILFFVVLLGSVSTNANPSCAFGFIKNKINTFTDNMSSVVSTITSRTVTNHTSLISQNNKGLVTGFAVPTTLDEALNYTDSYTYTMSGSENISSGYYLYSGLSDLVLTVVGSGNNIVFAQGSPADVSIYSTGPNTLRFEGVGSVNSSGGIVNAGITGFSSGFVSNSVGTLEIVNSVVSSNTVTDASLIKNGSDGTVNISGSTFDSNRTNKNGGAISSAGTLNVENSVFTGNVSNATADEANGGGAIYSTGTINIKDTDFKNNRTVSYGAAIYTTGGRITAETRDVYFSNNRADKQGGAIHLEEGGTALDILGLNGYKVIFDNNSAYDKAVISVNSDFTIDNAIFRNNKSTRTEGLGFGAIGGFQYVLTGNISNTLFESNTAAGTGGAIHSGNSESHYTITDTSFIGNTALNSGGAIHSACNMSITDSIFPSNSPTNDGGAIYTEGDLHVENSTFSSNQADKSGGAIYNPHPGNALAIFNCIFEKNTVDDLDGGAIYSEGYLYLENSTFSFNQADESGGAIYIRSQSELNAYNCVFINNIAINYTFM